jgi:hypothetical protein
MVDDMLLLFLVQTKKKRSIGKFETDCLMRFFDGPAAATVVAGGDHKFSQRRSFFVDNLTSERKSTILVSTSCFDDAYYNQHTSRRNLCEVTID